MVICPTIRIADIALAGVLLLSASSVANGQSAQHVNPPLLQGGDFKPGFDDLMTMLIQPRHTKLYYAGSESNWELAAFELRELRSGFRRALQVMPKYQNNDVAAALQAFMEPKLASLEGTIKTGNSQAFAKAFSGLSDGCNACHAFMEHPFLVIKTPNATNVNSNYADQTFGK